jgi:photosystem II stability/assembly factor-like uncharacterized protein
MLSMNMVEKSLVAAGLFVVAQIASAQIWTQTSAPSNNWASVASSADGSKLVAAASTGLIYISTNSGANWTFTSAPVGNWYSVSSSADGTKLAAVSDNGPIYISTDSGTDWTLTDAPTNLWTSVASAADGNKLIAAALSTNAIYTSADSGTNWTQQTNTFNYSPFSPFAAASSADGGKLVVVAYNVHYSTNSGTNWAQTGAPLTLSTAVFPSQIIASSADGSKWVAAETFSDSANPAPIHTTTNSGTSWTLTGAPSNYWVSVAMSADGSKIVAASSLVGFFPTNVPGPIYTSTNFGVNWTAASAPKTNWISVASSADGNQLVAAVQNGGIWISQTTPSPQLNFAPAGGSFKISWLIPSTNFVMQHSSNMVSWSNMTNSPVLNLTNLQNEVVLSPTNGSRFFRLKTP